jgi:hypothetical protein
VPRPDAQRAQRQPGAQRAAGHRHAVGAAGVLRKTLLEGRGHGTARQARLLQRGLHELHFDLTDIRVGQQQRRVGLGHVNPPTGAGPRP